FRGDGARSKRPAGRFRARDRPAAARRTRDLHAPRRRRPQASRDRGAARHHERHVEAAASPGADADAAVFDVRGSMQDEWTDRLSEYLDGELTDEERYAVESHHEGC